MNNNVEFRITQVYENKKNEGHDVKKERNHTGVRNYAFVILLELLYHSNPANVLQPYHEGPYC